MTTSTDRDLVERVRAGDEVACARLMTLAERGEGAFADQHRRFAGSVGRARRVGITGPPGAGKSTLVERLGLQWRGQRRSVGIVAVDPSSPFTRGAILGDRVRMQELTNDPGVFIRSMATRGAMGGLAAGTIDAMMVLDAFGMDFVVVETVGAGQDEVDVVRAAQTVLVVEIPGTGDGVQALKAGILEIADIFVVNKADREGADAVAGNLRQLLSLQPKPDRSIPILKTVATKNEGIEALADAIEAHQSYLRETGKLEQREAEKARFQLLALAQQYLVDRLARAGAAGGLLDDLVRAVTARQQDPYTAADRLIASILEPMTAPVTEVAP